MSVMGVWVLALLMSSSLVVLAYQVPRTSETSLQMHSDGTMTIDILFRNWTGFWAFSKVIPAGEFRFQKCSTVGLQMHMYMSFSQRCLCNCGNYCLCHRRSVFHRRERWSVVK